MRSPVILYKLMEVLEFLIYLWSNKTSTSAALCQDQDAYDIYRPLLPDHLEKYIDEIIKDNQLAKHIMNTGEDFRALLSGISFQLLPVEYNPIAYYTNNGSREITTGFYFQRNPSEVIASIVATTMWGDTIKLYTVKNKNVLNNFCPINKITYVPGFIPSRTIHPAIITKIVSKLQLHGHNYGYDIEININESNTYCELIMKRNIYFNKPKDNAVIILTITLDLSIYEIHY